MTARRAQALQMAGWVALLGVVLAVLTTGGPAFPPMSPDRWGDWLWATAPVEAAFALVRLGALAVTWYVAAVTLVGVGVRLVRAPRLTAVTDRLTVPPVRRLLAGLGMATVGLAGGMAPGVGPTVAVAAVEAPVAGEPGPPSPDTTITMRRLPPADEVPPSTAGPPAAVPPAAAPASSRTVGSGDCFWTIAEEVLTRSWGRPADEREIVPYWQRLIDANRSALAAPSNPDLIYVGQTFALPAP